jgi:PKD repeat protein
MRVEPNILAALFNGRNVYEITDGIISVDIIDGLDSFDGPWQQPDVGQFTLVTRNELLDPYLNEDVKFNAKIKFYGISPDPGTPYVSFFTGFITDINVEYIPNDKPIITINGVNAIGLLKRAIITQEFLDYIDTNTTGPFPYADYPNGIDIEDFCDVLGQYQYVAPLFKNYVFDWEVQDSKIDGGGSSGQFPPFAAYRPARFWPQVGDSIWDILIQYAKTNLDFIYFDTHFNKLEIRTFPKYSSSYWVYDDSTDIWDFDSESEYGYKEISITDGFLSLTNGLEITNTTATASPTGVMTVATEEFPFEQDVTSATDWGQNSIALDLSISPEFADQPTVSRYIDDVLQRVSTPSIKVQEITADALKPSPRDTLFGNRYYFYDIGDELNIKHKINDINILEGYYDIVGIRHSITYSDWDITFTVKPSESNYVKQEQYANATIGLNATTGDSNFMFTGTIENYPVEEIDEVIWLLNSYEADPIGYDYAVAGTWSKGVQLTGLSKTWNYDDDGILNEQIGAGYYVACAWIRNINGYIQFVNSEYIEVTAATPVANFTYTVNSYGQVSFIDASFDAEEWTWDFDDGTTSVLETPPIHTFPGPGTYDVSLTISNGLYTASTSQSITITNMAIPVKYVKYLWNGTTNSTTAPFLRGINELQVLNVGSMHYVKPIVTTGNVYKLGTTTNWNPVRTVPADQILTNGTTSSSGVTVTPVTSGSNETANIGLDFYMGTLDGYGNETWTDNALYNFTDTWMYPTGYSTNIHYKPIDIYVSPDQFNWYKVGDFSFYVTSYPPAGTVRAWSMDNKVPVLPPVYPTGGSPDISYPEPIMTFTETITDNGATYAFATSNTNTTSYLWNFGDGTTSTLQNPTKTFPESGPYTITLTKTNQYGSKTISQGRNVNITVDKTGTQPVRYVLLKRTTPTSSFGTSYYIPNYRNYAFNSPQIRSFQATTNGTLTDRALGATIKNVYNLTSSNLIWRTNNSVDKTSADLINNTYMTDPNSSLAPYSWTTSPPTNQDFAYMYGLVLDLGANYYDIYDIKASFNRVTVNVPNDAMPSIYAGNTYYSAAENKYTVSVYTGATTPSAIYNASEWEEIGTIQSPQSPDTDPGTFETIKIAKSQVLPLI